MLSFIVLSKLCCVSSIILLPQQRASPPGSALPSAPLFLFCLQYFFPFSFCWASLWLCASLHYLLCCEWQHTTQRENCDAVPPVHALCESETAKFVYVWEYTYRHMWLKVYGCESAHVTYPLIANYACTAIQLHVCIIVCVWRYTQDGSGISRISTASTFASVFECTPLTNAKLPVESCILLHELCSGWT